MTNFSKVLGASPLRHAHPQTPTTTPLYRRVAKNPHFGATR